MMRAAIATLIITSAVFAYSIELNSQSTRIHVDPASKDENPHPSLNHIPGLQIPQGEEIRHRCEIIAVNQNGVIVPYIQDGAFTILKPKPRDVKNPEVIAFEAQHITDDEWLVAVAHWAHEAHVGSWAVDSAVATVLRTHLAQVAAKRDQHDILQQKLLAHHRDTSVDQHGLLTFEPPRLGFRMDQHERSKSFELQLSKLRIEPDESDASSTSTRISTASSTSGFTFTSPATSRSTSSSTSRSSSRSTSRSTSDSSKHQNTPRLKIRDIRAFISGSKSSRFNKK